MTYLKHYPQIRLEGLRNPEQ